MSEIEREAILAEFRRFTAQQIAAQQASERPCPTCGIPCPRGPDIHYCDMCGARLEDA